MKKIKQLLNLSFLSFMFLAAYAFNSKPPCDPEALLKNCASDLDDFVFIKSFPIETNKEGDKSEYSYVLSRGVNYKIVVCNGSSNEKKMIVNLFDRNKKLILSNYIKSSKKIFSTINYMCAATGVYYVEAYFEGEKKGCGLNILGFKK